MNCFYLLSIFTSRDKKANLKVKLNLIDLLKSNEVGKEKMFFTKHVLILVQLNINKLVKRFIKRKLLKQINSIKLSQISIDKDRENLTKRLNEEHNMRRLEQKELVQRLDNNENTGKAEISDLFSKLKREQVLLLHRFTQGVKVGDPPHNNFGKKKLLIKMKWNAK